MSGKDDQKTSTENADDHAQAADGTSHHPIEGDTPGLSDDAAIPEVEAEVVNEQEMGAASSKDDVTPETIDAVAEEITADAATGADTTGKISPWIILLGVIGLLGMGLLGKHLLRGGEAQRPKVEAFDAHPTAEKAKDVGAKTPDGTTEPASTPTADTAAKPTGGKDHSDSVIKSSAASGADTVDDTGADTGAEGNSAAPASEAQNAAEEEPADRIDLSTTAAPAIDPRVAAGDGAVAADVPEDDPEDGTDPRAAIEALQRLAEGRLAATDDVGRTDATKADEPAAGSADIADQDVAPSDLDQGAVAADETLSGDETAAAAPQMPVDGAGETTALTAPTGKIVNEFAQLKEAVQQRTAALDEALSAEREKQAEDLASLRDELASALDERDRRSSEEIADLRNRIEKIQSGGLPAGRQAMAALALNALQQKVAAGGIFTEELEVLVRLAPDAPVISAVQPFASTGVPTVPALVEEFQLARRDAMKRANLAKADGWLDVMVANLKNLVSVRPAAARDGDDVVSVISRAEAGLATGDIARAVAETSRLDGEALEAFSGWLAKARNTSIALDALREMNAALLNQFGESTATQ